MTDTIKKFLLIPLALVLMAPGDKVGNGGDRFVTEFIQTALIVHQKTLTGYYAPGFSTSRFLRLIRSAQITSQPKLELNGHAVDFINYPYENPPEIEISREAWTALATDQARKEMLVFHEFLSLMGFDDRAYQYSDIFLQQNDIFIFESLECKASARSREGRTYKLESPMRSTLFKLKGQICQGYKMVKMTGAPTEYTFYLMTNAKIGGRIGPDSSTLVGFNVKERFTGSFDTAATLEVWRDSSNNAALKIYDSMTGNLLDEAAIQCTLAKPMPPKCSGPENVDRR